MGLGLGLLRGKVQFKAVCDGLRQHLVRFILQGDEIQLDRGPWRFWHIFLEGTCYYGCYGSNTVLCIFGFPTCHSPHTRRPLPNPILQKLHGIDCSFQLLQMHNCKVLACSLPWTRATWGVPSCQKGLRHYLGPSPSWCQISCSSWKTCSSACRP